MSLLFNTLSIFVIAFLPRSKNLLILWLQFIVILEPKKITSVTVSIIFPSICPEVMWPDAIIIIFWMLSFKTDFSLSSFTFIKRLFSSSSLSVISMVSFAYMRLLIFLPGVLTPACALSSPNFLRLYSAYKLNKQVTIYSLDVPLPNLESVQFSMSSSNYGFLTCIRVSQKAGNVVWYFLSL